jgi:hypothetical protein
MTMTVLENRAIVTALTLSSDYELVTKDFYYGSETGMALFKNGKLLAEKSFDFSGRISLEEKFKEIREWLNPVLNPNLKMFSHIKF